MKPEQWIIEDIGRLRKKPNKTENEQQYLNLLTWYVQDAMHLVDLKAWAEQKIGKVSDSQRQMLKVAAECGEELEPAGPLIGPMPWLKTYKDSDW